VQQDGDVSDEGDDLFVARTPAGGRGGNAADGIDATDVSRVPVPEEQLQAWDDEAVEALRDRFVTGRGSVFVHRGQCSRICLAMGLLTSSRCRLFFCTWRAWRDRGSRTLLHDSSG
jgi:hypothetical protein